MSKRTRWLVCGLLLGSGCITEYTVGGANDGGCGDGQVVCGDACVAAGSSCDDCSAGQVKCGDACVAPDTCSCAQGCDQEYEACGDGVCVCRPGLTRCGAACVDLRADAEHCGSCDGACSGAEVQCQASECVAQCAAPLVACGGACVDFATDSLNCGECDRPCKSDEVCLAGDCRNYAEISDCAACPCPDQCVELDTAEGGDELEGGECCDSPFIGGPVCVEDGCD